MEGLVRSFDQIYRGRRVLLTGHTGFKGSWLGLWLSMLEAKVFGFALPPDTEPAHFSLLDLQTQFNHNIGDIRNLDQLLDVFNLAQPEIVFHLAAQPLVRKSYDDPKETFDTNIGGTVNILEAIRRTKSVKAAVIVTSDKCYKNNEWIWGYRENDPLGGNDPYSASKGAAEIVCEAFYLSFFKKQLDPVGLATVRAGNVIGGGDWAEDRIIPDCVRAITDGKPIKIRNRTAIRPWQHVLDPLAGYLLLAQNLFIESDKNSGPWNFGPSCSQHINVEEIARSFIEKWGQGTIEFISATQAPHEAHCLRLVIDKASTVLKWKPVLDAKESIDWTVEWYRQWFNKSCSIKELSRSQIVEYMKRAQ